MARTVALRTRRFQAAARLAGYASDYSLAHAMEVERSTLSRVLKGSQRPGPLFIGGALKALAPLQFEDLFEVVPVV